MRSVRPTRAVAAVLAAGPAGALARPPTAAVVAPTAPLPAPTGITVARDPADPMDFVVRWKGSTGPRLHHVNVSVFADGADHVTVVPAGTTELRVEGTSWTSRYRITVASRDVAGVGTTSGYVWLQPAVPGAPARSSSNGWVRRSPASRLAGRLPSGRATDR